MIDGTIQIRINAVLEGYRAGISFSSSQEPESLFWRLDFCQAQVKITILAVPARWICSEVEQENDHVPVPFLGCTVKRICAAKSKHALLGCIQVRFGMIEAMPLQELDNIALSAAICDCIVWCCLSSLSFFIACSAIATLMPL